VNLAERQYFQVLREEEDEKSKDDLKLGYQTKEEGESSEDFPEEKPQTFPIFESSSSELQIDETWKEELGNLWEFKKSSLKISAVFSVAQFSLQEGFKCKICNKTLKTKNYLEKHYKSIHTTTKNFTCDFCNKSVYHKQHMEYHMKQHLLNPRKMARKSEAIRPFQCDLCLKGFKTSSQLEAHQITHSGENDSFEVRNLHCISAHSFQMFDLSHVGAAKHSRQKESSRLTRATFTTNRPEIKSELSPF
jgi:uncharacterized Zn-finger protein